MPDAKQFIIKTPEASCGEGVIVVSHDELNTLLDLLLSPQNDARMMKEMMYFSFKNDREKHITQLEFLRVTKPTYYLVEEYITNKPVSYNHKNYDATMRFVFAFTQDNETERKIFPLAYYWKLPPQAMNSKSELRTRCISSFTDEHCLATQVSGKDAAIVFDRLKDTLPDLFACMLQQDMLALAKEDFTKNRNSYLWLDICKLSTEHGHFNIAKYAFKQVLHNNEDYYLADYHMRLGKYHYLSGHYVRQLKT